MEFVEKSKKAAQDVVEPIKKQAQPEVKAEDRNKRLDPLQGAKFEQGAAMLSTGKPDFSTDKRVGDLATQGIVTGSDVSVRDRPSDFWGAKVGMLKKGQTIYKLSQKGSWLQIAFQGGSAYIEASKVHLDMFRQAKQATQTETPA